MFQHLSRSSILQRQARSPVGKEPKRNICQNLHLLPIILGWLLGFLSLLCPLALAVAQPAQPTTEPENNETQSIRLSSDQIKKSGIRTAIAAAGPLNMTLSLSGQVKINTDQLVQVVPRVAGVVRKINKTLGDQVEAGEVLVIIDSRELADARAAYLAAQEHSALALATFQRKKHLWQEKIVSQQDYQEAKERLAVAKIEEYAAKQKLLTMGIPAQELQRLTRQSLESTSPKDLLSRYNIIAPFAGTILERHITLGEALAADVSIFTISDLDTVWVDLYVFPKDLLQLRVGQTVTVTAADLGLQAEGKIIHVQPLIDENTRRTFARVELDNSDGRWQPGLFVNGLVQTGVIDVPLQIMRAAIQNIGNDTVVFIQGGDGFEPRPVTLGRGDDSRVEIIAGLKAGERYVGAGTFILKSILQKGEDDDD